MVGTEKTADYKSAGTTVDLPRHAILTTYCSVGFVIRRGIGRLQICRNKLHICRDNGGSAETTQRMVSRNNYCTGTEECQKDKKGVRNYGACVRSGG